MCICFNYNDSEMSKSDNHGYIYIYIVMWCIYIYIYRTETPTSPWTPQPTAPGVCSCVCFHCCLCALRWVKCRAQILSMGHHTWPHVTSLSLNSFMSGCSNNLTPDCFLNEGQFKAGFVKKLKTQRWIINHVHDPAAPPKEVSLTHYIFLWLFANGGLGEQCSLACLATKLIAVNRAAFDQVWVLFFTTTEIILKRP